MNTEDGTEESKPSISEEKSTADTGTDLAQVSDTQVNDEGILSMYNFIARCREKRRTNERKFELLLTFILESSYYVPKHCCQIKKKIQPGPKQKTRITMVTRTMRKVTVTMTDLPSRWMQVSLVSGMYCELNSSANYKYYYIVSSQ